MAVVDEYILMLTSEQQEEFSRIRQIVYRVAPSVEQGISYALPTYLYGGKPLLSCVVNKKFCSIYPFSGKVIDKLREKLSGYELTPGSIHFSPSQPLSVELLTEILIARMREIDFDRNSVA
jgi:uncharacterized protein YdhG (YjbR/CyaY superfamily)